MKECYFRELQSIKGVYFDVAFLPVDPRLKGRVLKGTQAFLQYTSCDLLVPMHFWEDAAVFIWLRHSEVQNIEIMQLWLGLQEPETFTKA